LSIDARTLAYRVVCRFRRTGAFVKESLDRELQKGNLSLREKALATELAYGVIRHRISLEHLVGVFANRDLSRIETPVLDALCLGLYQLLYLERVPLSAAVNETVTLARREIGERAVGFTNGLLRSVSRAFQWTDSSCGGDPRCVLPCAPGRLALFDRPVLPDPAEHPANWLALVYAHPKWLVARWLGRFGHELTERICEANNQSPPVHVRWRGTDEPPDQFEPVESVAGMYRVSSPGLVPRLPGYDDGAFAVQGLPSARSVQALCLEPGLEVMDACAAPGTKAMHAADLVGAEGKVLAVDKSLRRMRKLKENGARLCIMNVYPFVGDATCIENWLQKDFQRVLVDVPCSNTGELSRRVEVRHRLNPRDLGPLTEIQSSLLCSAAGRLAHSGILVYSTCSLEEEEGPEVIRNFLSRCPGYALQEEHWLLPHDHGSVGGFMARIIRH